MTPFEQQVAEALGPRCAELLLPVTVAAQKLGSATDLATITKYRAELDRACDALYDGLAPRVAAAIEAVVREHRGNIPAAEWPGLQASAYAAALAALRGEP